MKPADPDAAKLLRWYPRAWRERYGEEFLAMVEDSLDGERPGRQIRRRVAWGAGATAAAGGGLAALVLVQGSMTYDQLSESGVFALGAVGTGLLLTAAFGLWANAAKATVSPRFSSSCWASSG